MLVMNQVFTTKQKFTKFQNTFKRCFGTCFDVKIS